MKKTASPVFWGSLILVLSLFPTFYVASKQRVFAEENQLSQPEVSAGLPIAYFFGAVVVIGIILALVPVSRLRIILQALFALLFAWGIFILLGLTLPFVAAVIIAAGAGLVWLFKPKVWLHDLVLLLALASMGSVFGFLLSPWTAIVFMLVISVYDILAVRFGYMLWMARRLTESQAMPAFIIPKDSKDWNLNLRKSGFNRIFQSESGERDFSILGGGDVGFPLLLIASVYFVYDFTGALVIAVFSLTGLISAYGIQALFLKGKPMPALPPIAILSLTGFLIVQKFIAS